jgi:NADH:ubiquinone oxidoreductase subunit D
VLRAALRVNWKTLGLERRMAMFKRSTKSAKGFDWAGLGWLFLFFWYFSGITQLLIQLSGTSGFSGFRQAFFMSALWLAPMLVFPRQTRVLAAVIGVMLWACSMASLGYFFVYQQEFSQSVIFIMFESNISEAGEYLTQYFAWWIVLAFIAHTALAIFLWTRVRPVYLPRGQALRVIAAELNRISSHLVTVGCYGLDMGAFTPFTWCFREREMILDLLEALCGARLTYSYITVGGVRWDLPDGWIDKCREFLDFFGPKIVDYNNLLSYNHIFLKRTCNVGVISLEDAIAYGLTGPCLRGSGIRWDLRKVSPYDGYEKYDFDIPIGLPGGTEDRPEGVVVGDNWSRYYLRVLEMSQSVRIIHQALDQLPEGDVLHKKVKNLKLPEDETYAEVENPRGQLGFYVRGDGSAIPYRVKARGPSFCNLSILSRVCRGILIADMPAFIASIDIVLGEVDR